MKLDSGRPAQIAAGTQLRLDVVVLPSEMSTSTSVPALDVPYGLAMPRAQAWWGVLDWLRQSRSRPRRAVTTGCFGRLATKEEMVAKGLAASLTCSTEQGQERW